MAAGLAAAHAVGLVHRDVKPANILFDPDHYDSTLALADNLQRFLGGEPIVARPVPTWDRWFRRARRYSTRLHKRSTGSKPGGNFVLAS